MKVLRYSPWLNRFSKPNTNYSKLWIRKTIHRFYHIEVLCQEGWSVKAVSGSQLYSLYACHIWLTFSFASVNRVCVERKKLLCPSSYKKNLSDHISVVWISICLNLSAFSYRSRVHERIICFVISSLTRWPNWPYKTLNHSTFWST